jgi:hypothetical protein
LNITVILDGLVSHALASGLFERVNAHEPKSAPGNGLTAAVWADEIGPDPGSSGLAATSGVVTFLVRLYTSMLSEPQDAIDPLMLSAVDTLMTAYSGDFELSGAARCVDLLGQTGKTLSAKAGYLNQDSKVYRVMTITVPVIVSDVWDQSP